MSLCIVQKQPSHGYCSVRASSKCRTSLWCVVQSWLHCKGHNAFERDYHRLSNASQDIVNTARATKSSTGSYAPLVHTEDAHHSLIVDEPGPSPLRLHEGRRGQLSPCGRPLMQKLSRELLTLATASSDDLLILKSLYFEAVFVTAEPYCHNLCAATATAFLSSSPAVSEYSR